MVEAGGVPAGISRWSPAGWITPPDGVPSAISLRRERLDPLLRGIAGQTPGVDLILGQRVTGLLTEGGRVVGVRTRDGAGAEYEHRARLVVGADGYHSTVAGLAGAREDRAPNNRFGMWAYYRGVTARAPGPNHVWNQGPDTAIAIRTDDDLTMLVAFPVKERLAEFQADRADALERFIRRLPDAPDLSVRVARLQADRHDRLPVRAARPDPGSGAVPGRRRGAGRRPAARGGLRLGVPRRRVAGRVDHPRCCADSRASGRRRAGYRRRLRFIERHDRVSRRAALAGPPNRMERAMLTGRRRGPGHRTAGVPVRDAGDRRLRTHQPGHGRAVVADVPAIGGGVPAVAGRVRAVAPRCRGLDLAERPVVPRGRRARTGSTEKEGLTCVSLVLSMPVACRSVSSRASRGRRRRR